VVQVAALVPHKDPVTFVRAVALVRNDVPDVRALLVGEGPLRDDVERERRRLGLEETLFLTGYRTDADAILAAADAVVLSSREEGMGSVLLDALAFGRPVAATAAGGIPDVIRDAETGLLSPVGDAEALAASVCRLLLDPPLTARLVSRGSVWVREFGIERAVERTLSVYHAVLARTR
jgi:glycosyltransferase involved in cell wall biosynthesis